MNKKGKLGIGEIAGIILIVLILVILIVSLSGLYGQTFKDSIKKLFGIETETEIHHKSNVKGEDCFESLTTDIKKCKDSEKINCGCKINIECFGSNHILRTNDKGIELQDIGKTDDKSIYDKKGNLLKKDTEIYYIDCMFNKKLERIRNKIMTIYFHKSQPEITYIDTNFWDKIFRKGFHTVKKDINEDYQLYKINEDMCWLQETNKEIQSC